MNLLKGKANYICQNAILICISFLLFLSQKKRQLSIESCRFLFSSLNLSILKKYAVISS